MLLLYETSLMRTVDVPGLGEAARAVLDRAGAGEGQPFALGPNGEYDVELNRFFREMVGWGVRSPLSVEAYARDLTLFGRFLYQRRGGRSIWSADQEDLRAYKRVRRRIEGPSRVSASTWNRFIAALDKWVSWAVYERLLAAPPFRKVEKTVLTPRGLATVSVNAEYDSGEEPAPVRFLAYEDYVLWRDVGLRGQLPGGGVDPSWRGRHGERNACFADLLICTGMRLTEASSLLVNEIPPLVERRKVGELFLPATITKRSKARTVFISRRVLRALHHYLEIERDELIMRRAAAGAYAKAREGEDSWLRVDRAGRTSIRVVGGNGERPANLPCSRLTISQRRRVARIGDADRLREPLWLWLGEDGLPLSRSTWQATFRRANERCASLGLDLAASPHTLRHTFAVHMLGLLLRQTVRALRAEDARSLTGEQVKRLLIGDPLRRLQLLLGHRHQETTYVYLDVLDEAQEIVLSALAEWDEQAEALARVRLEAEAAEGAA